jgi:hypothetical protein
MEINVEVDPKKILEKVTNDKFGLFVSQSWKRLIDPYTPRRTGQLIGITGATVELQPFEIHYNTNYAEYVYESDDWNFFKELSPFATDHWDEKAAEAGQVDKLYKTLNNYLNR